MPDRPQEMYRNGRPPVPEFLKDECCYIRVHPSRIQPDNVVDPGHVQCPDLSSNRSQFSQPWYVLYPRKDFEAYAVFRFRPQEILKTVKSENLGGGTPVAYEVRTVHDPYEDNYGHCETRLYRDEERMEPNKISKGAKKVFREHMSRALKLERPAGIVYPPPKLC